MKLIADRLVLSFARATIDTDQLALTDADRDLLPLLYGMEYGACVDPQIGEAFVAHGTLATGAPFRVTVWRDSVGTESTLAVDYLPRESRALALPHLAGATAVVTVGEMEAIFVELALACGV